LQCPRTDHLISCHTIGLIFQNHCRLVHNPICNPPDATKSYCAVSQSNTPPYSTPSNNNCLPAQCTSDQISSPNCKCAYAYSGTLVFRAPNFSDLGISSYYLELQSTLMQRFKDCSLPVDSVSLRNPIQDSSTMNLNLSLDVFVNISPLSSIDSPRADNDSPYKAQLHERLNAVATLSSPHSDSIQRLSRDSKIR
jgi:hypothetical protein